MSDIAQRMRTDRQIWAAPGSSHDRVIHLLQMVLPVAIGVLAAFLVMAPLTMGGDVSFMLAKNSVQIAKERLRIESATYRGEDAKGRPFAIRAGSAVQKSSAEPIVRMKDLAAEMRLPDGPADITSPGGNYDLDSQKVALAGPIEFRAPDGYRLDTDGATVDLKTKTMKSSGGVTGTVRQGSFSADSMSADLDNRSVSLDGNARLRIVPGKTK